VEAERRHNGKHNEKRQNDELRDKEGRLGLCRRQRLQERQLLESLYDPDEDVEIESHPQRLQRRASARIPRADRHRARGLRPPARPAI
jgi:hypothetical protein